MARCLKIVLFLFLCEKVGPETPLHNLFRLHPCTTGYLESIIDNNLLCFFLGLEAGLLAGVEEAMLKMNMGEKAHVWIHPGKWGFGTAGKPELGIPGNAALEYIIHLKTFENVS